MGRWTQSGSLERGPERGVVIHLTDAQRVRVDAIPDTGYLSKLEAARRNGLIADYPVFPAGHLSKGLAPVGALTPMSRESALTW